MSLVTTPASSLAICGGCGGNRVTAIAMTLTDGSSVAFHSCHTCSYKSWQQEGTDLSLDAVLGKAAKRR